MALEAAGLKPDEIWVSYFAIGGSSGVMEVQAYTYGALSLPCVERDLLAHALNEFLDARGLYGARATYSDQIAGPGGEDPDASGRP